MGTSKEAELRKQLDQTAKMLAEIYNNPASWITWMIYLFQKLEAQASITPSNKSAFKDMLDSLQESMRNRQETGGW